MDQDRVQELLQTHQGHLRGIVDHYIELYLRPLREKQLYIAWLEMTPEDRAHTRRVLGDEVYGRYESDMKRIARKLEKKHGYMG